MQIYLNYITIIILTYFIGEFDIENEILNTLANEIIEKLSGKIIIENEMKDFLLSEINKEHKAKVLEQLYLFQLYSNAYIGPDPRGQMRFFINATSILNAKNDDEILDKLENLKETVEFMKNREIHPLDTIKRKLEDKEKYKHAKF